MKWIILVMGPYHTLDKEKKEVEAFLQQDFANLNIIVVHIENEVIRKRDELMNDLNLSERQSSHAGVSSPDIIKTKPVEGCSKVFQHICSKTNEGYLMTMSRRLFYSKDSKVNE